MAARAVVRPVWRRFVPRFVDRAAAHVRAGGHAAIVRDDRVDLLLPVDGAAGLPLFARWTLLTLGQSRWRRVREGPAAGLATARVRRELEGAVLDFCERDATLPGPTRRMLLDCLACAACCRDADVVLDGVDVQRWRDAGRPELAARGAVRRDAGGRMHLVMLANGRCRHLGRDLRCGIYAIRPDNCRAFPAGSEACLSARRDTLGLDDPRPRRPC